MTSDLVPWVTQNLSTTGHEQNWLIGFSKSGIGGQDLILKHPDVFTLAASWDFPLTCRATTSLGARRNYGTDANFQANYRLTPIFLEAHKLPFISNNRIWIGGYWSFPTEMSGYDALLNTEGILHTTEMLDVDAARTAGQRLGADRACRAQAGQPKPTGRSTRRARRPCGSSSQSVRLQAPLPVVARGRLSLTNMTPWPTKTSSPIVDAVADEGVALDLAARADDRPALDLDERADPRAVADRCSRRGS